jgi:SAM-dependent methyltransferase
VAAEGRASTPTGFESGSAELARWYDIDLQGYDEDLNLYVALAGRLGGSVLELAVGSGRIAVPLAVAGHRVRGVDRDPHMLARARAAWQAADGASESAGSLELIEADITQLSLGEKFELVILGFNSLLALDGRAGQAACLRVIAQHLAPGGRAVIDVWLPSPDDLAIYDSRITLDWMRHDPQTGQRVAKLTSARYDAATATAELTTFFDAWPIAGGPVTRVARHDSLSLIGATELLDLAAHAGLAVETVAGDHELTAFGPGSDRIVLVCGLL